MDNFPFVGELLDAIGADERLMNCRIAFEYMGEDLKIDSINIEESYLEFPDGEFTKADNTLTIMLKRML